MTTPKINNNEAARRVIFTHIGVRESTRKRLDDKLAAYIAKIGHKVSMAEYMDALSKVHLPFET